MTGWKRWQAALGLLLLLTLPVCAQKKNDPLNPLEIDQLRDVMLDPEGNTVNACDQSCGTSPMAAGDIAVGGTLRGIAHHVRWPSASNPQMFEFMKQHPLAPAGK